MFSYVLHVSPLAFCLQPSSGRKLNVSNTLVHDQMPKKLITFPSGCILKWASYGQIVGHRPILNVKSLLYSIGPIYIFQLERCCKIQLPVDAPVAAGLRAEDGRADSVSDSVTITVSAVNSVNMLVPPWFDFSAGRAGNPPGPVDKAAHYFCTLSHFPWTNLLSVWMGRLAFFNAAV